MDHRGFEFDIRGVEKELREWSPNGFQAAWDILCEVDRKTAFRLFLAKDETSMQAVGEPPHPSL
jgi:hypothetical protein